MKVIHIICRFDTMLGGAELECLDLANRLRERGNKVSIWATKKSRISSSYLRKYSIRRIRPFSFPISGTLIISGGWIKPRGHWTRLSRFNRIIIICNNPRTSPEKIKKRYRKRLGLTPELVYLSRSQPFFSVQHAATIHPSPIVTHDFEPKDLSVRGEQGPVVIGRLSRDALEKHHPEDPMLYRELVSQGRKVRLMGASQLINYDPDIAGCKEVTFIEAGQETASEFLTSLDIFFYRGAPGKSESFGRVVPEAMLSGLPVVCGHNGGGYTALIKHGINGFLFKDTAQARTILSELAENTDLRQRIGLQARKDMLELYSPEAMAERLRFYED